MQKTFGWVHPYKARSHIAGWSWKDEWWTARRELRLTVRAECHYSNGWKGMLCHSRNKSCSCMPAERRCLRVAWDSWDVYMRMKHRMQHAGLRSLALNIAQILIDSTRTSLSSVIITLIGSTLPCLFVSEGTCCNLSAYDPLWWHHLQTQQVDELVEERYSLHQHDFLQRVLHVWKETAAARSSEKRAENHYRHCAVGMEESHILCQTVTGSDARNGTLNVETGRPQVVRLQHRRRAAEQTELALWHWSLSLQAKVLEAVGRGAAPEAGEAGAGCQFYRDQLLRKGVAHAAHMGSFSTNIALHSQEQIVLCGVSRGGVAVETDSRWRCVLPDDNHDVLEFCCTPRSKNCYHLQLLYHLQPRSQ
ncbi:uncharacterized protein ACWYII_039497 [Salvelinus alpinus]